MPSPSLSVIIQVFVAIFSLWWVSALSVCLSITESLTACWKMLCNNFEQGSGKENNFLQYLGCWRLGSIKQQRRRDVINAFGCNLISRSFYTLCLKHAQLGGAKDSFIAWLVKRPPESWSPVACSCRMIFAGDTVFPHLKDYFIDTNEEWKLRSCEPNVKQIKIKGFPDLLWTNQQGFCRALVILNSGSWTELCF